MTDDCMGAGTEGDCGSMLTRSESGMLQQMEQGYTCLAECRAWCSSRRGRGRGSGGRVFMCEGTVYVVYE